MSCVKILVVTFAIFCALHNADSATYRGLTTDNYLLVDELYTLAYEEVNDLNGLHGHPLGHVRGPGGDVINYSTGSEDKKSTLVDKDTTMRLIHLLLRHDTGRTALNNLNGVGGKPRANFQIITFTLAQVSDVIDKSTLLSAVPVVYKYQNGVEEVRRDGQPKTYPLRGFRFVLRHQRGRKSIDDNPVFIQTAYPL